jgi:ribosome-associated heat shock protein Hsp15
MNKSDTNIDPSLRIDKWLWAVRVYKSRTLATEACNGGKVKINGKRIKPSYYVKTGEVLTVQSGYILRTYKVLGLNEKRVSAKVAVQFIEDITPKEELLKMEIGRHASYISRYRGSGRPTKKERRTMEKINPFQ